MAERLTNRFRNRDDQGIAIVMVSVLLAFMMAAGLVVIAAVSQQTVLSSHRSMEAAALAAAEAGVQDYRQLLNTDPNYWQYSASNLPPTSNPALSGFESISGTTPPESFSYAPDTAGLSSGGQLGLLVTGKAGNGPVAQYRTIEVNLTVSGPLLDEYYTSYEVGAASNPLIYENTYDSSGAHVTGNEDETLASVTYTPAGTNSAVTESLAAALCQYRAWQPNTYVDSLGTLMPPAGYPGATAYSNANPFFGPWYGPWADPLHAGWTFKPACSVNYDTTGQTFSGPVYSQDEIATCGNPAFKGSPASLGSGVPANLELPVGWPGTKAVSGANYSSPYGYSLDPFGNCSSQTTDTPTVTNGPVLGQNLPLPSVSGLAADASLSSAQGCLYTGPTMIAFRWDASTNQTAMYVWSPLTKQTQAGCGDFSTEISSGQVNETMVQVSPPANGLIYVQSVPTVTSDPNYWSSLPTPPTGQTCLNPATPNAPASSPSCTAGDAIVGGVLNGGITVAADHNIVVSRNIGYSCALQTNSDALQSSLPAACNSSTDSLALIANSNVWLSNPVTSSGAAATACTDYGNSSTETGWSSIVPNCDPVNPVVDGALVALNGSVSAQNYSEGGSGGGTLSLNGSYISRFRGVFGTYSGSSVLTGFQISFGYDQRSDYLTPPDALAATGSNWTVASVTDCASSTSTAPPVSCPGTSD